MLRPIASPAEFWQYQAENASGKHSARAFLQKLLDHGSEVRNHSASAIQTAFLQEQSPSQLDVRV
jgi:hypothetical protein